MQATQSTSQAGERTQGRPQGHITSDTELGREVILCVAAVLPATIPHTSAWPQVIADRQYIVSMAGATEQEWADLATALPEEAHLVRQGDKAVITWPAAV